MMGRLLNSVQIEKGIIVATAVVTTTPSTSAIVAKVAIEQHYDECDC